VISKFFKLNTLTLMTRQCYRFVLAVIIIQNFKTSLSKDDLSEIIKTV